MRYFEDFPVGATHDFGDRLVTAEAIVDFAQHFDPQPMHLDPAAGASSMLGGHAASGWHNCAMLMRMMCDDYLLDTASMGSPGVEQTRWEHPVFAGDRLRARYTVLEARASQSKPDRGFAKIRHELFNQHGKRVMTMTSIAMLKRRSAT